jgi:hypothetical protein
MIESRSTSGSTMMQMQRSHEAESARELLYVRKAREGGHATGGVGAMTLLVADVGPCCRLRRGQGWVAAYVACGRRKRRARTSRRMADQVRTSLRSDRHRSDKETRAARATGPQRAARPQTATC